MCVQRVLLTHSAVRRLRNTLRCRDVARRAPARSGVRLLRTDVTAYFFYPKKLLSLSDSLPYPQPFVSTRCRRMRGACVDIAVFLNIPGWVVTVIKKAVLLSGCHHLHFWWWLGSADPVEGPAHSIIFGSGGEMRLRVDPPSSLTLCGREQRYPLRRRRRRKNFLYFFFFFPLRTYHNIT